MGPERFRAGGSDAVEERGRRDVAPDLPNRETPECDPDQPTGTRPKRSVKVSARRAGEDEAPGSGVAVDRPLDRAEDARDGLPLVEQDRLLEPAQDGVGIGPHGDGLRLPIEADDRACMPHGRRRLAKCTGPD